MEIKPGIPHKSASGAGFLATSADELRDLCVWEIISTLRKLYRRSKKYINAQKIISTFSEIYLRSLISCHSASIFPDLTSAPFPANAKKTLDSAL
ncbi:hypothetical protein D9754_10340 [Planomicrobium sp. Y74]|nr:hypothetical protein D9754_10340 [Planomicrobium sp. Y74]